MMAAAEGVGPMMVPTGVAEAYDGPRRGKGGGKSTNVMWSYAEATAGVDDQRSLQGHLNMGVPEIASICGDGGGKPRTSLLEARGSNLVWGRELQMCSFLRRHGMRGSPMG